MKKSRILLSLFLPLMLIGCASASGTYLITGTQREALGAESVVIYTEFPAQNISGKAIYVEPDKNAENAQ